VSSGRWVPRYKLDGWHPCPWAPGALIGYIEGLEIEVETTWTPSHGYLWIVRGYVPHTRSRYPDIIDSGYSRGIEIAKTRGANAARKLATPPRDIDEARKAWNRERERKRRISPESAARKSEYEKTKRRELKAAREAGAAAAAGAEATRALESLDTVPLQE
jgi:hypothetical protein